VNEQGSPDAPDEPQKVRLADAVRTVTAALGDVLTASPAPAGPAPGSTS